MSENFDPWSLDPFDWSGNRADAKEAEQQAQQVAEQQKVEAKQEQTRLEEKYGF